MKNVRNLRVVAAGLCLSASLLTTGCGNDEVNENEIVFGGNRQDISISYETEIPTGTISYEDLNKYIKIVTLNYDGMNKTLLMIKDVVDYAGGRYSSPHSNVEYIDFETGTTIVEYIDYSYDKEYAWIIGENLDIIKEVDITGYLLQEDFIKQEYTFEEILDFYKEKILPTLDNSEKELVK